MASRMERYHNSEGRSTRNKNLYKSIENLDNYSNIEGVIAIDKTNEIDITKVKKMIQNREGYQKSKQYHQIAPEEVVEEEQNFIEDTDNRTYDIRDVLTKAKETRVEPDEKYRTLKNVNYDVIKRLNLKPSEEEDVKKELVSTVTLHTNIGKTRTGTKEISDDDLGLLDDLKSDNKLEESTSIKKLIEEAREEQKELEDDNQDDNVSSELENIDKSFYTSSLGFTDSDFEDLKNLGEDIKKHNGLLKVLIVSIIIVVIVIIAFLCFQLLNK